MAMLRVVADSNIPGIAAAAAALSPRTEVRTLPPAEITAAAVREADLLFVRSTVRCGEALLGGSRVRFLATATIGTDHLDLPWLAGRGITAASAPGSNADSVVQWVAAALARPGRARPPRPLDLSGARAGVVGVGNVGGRVARLLRALGAEVRCCDPPRQRAGHKDWPYHTLDELCAWSDLLTLHVPLNREGEDRTVGLLDARRLGMLRPGAVLINAARGEVLDGAAARHFGGAQGALLLDVFPGEPSPDPALVEAAAIATPHIAGHSLEGKVNGTVMVYRAACAFLGVPATWTPGPDLLPPNPMDGQTIDIGIGVDRAGPRQAAVQAVLDRCYDISADDRALRRIVALPAAERGAAFQRYRQSYPVRRELTGARLTLAPHDEGLARVLRALGAVC
jgi:erythronate-4-phosphate dehydrogenase